ncbi:MAG: sugar ABC transporter permease [Lachnospiraceae bacterium]|nr:sugar ABC transporter permease [Lachnospiraceae bacterium]
MAGKSSGEAADIYRHTPAGKGDGEASGVYRRTLAGRVWRYKWLYLMLTPVMAYFIIFKYAPMYGIVMAFQKYNPFKGIFDSQWVGLDVFKKVLSNHNFWVSVKNTIVLNLLVLIVNFPLTIIISLMLNEIRHIRFKKFTQSVLYLPHFISWVVVAGIARATLFTTNGGTVNMLLESFGGTAKPFLSDTVWWTVMYVFMNTWKEVGWGTIIYLAALTGIDESLYEAAYLDGATRMQRIVYITLPLIKSTVVTMLILQVSRVMSIGLDAPLLLGNDSVINVSEVIATYVYRLGIVRNDYSQATAIGLFQSVVNILILVLADRFAKLIGEDGII